MIPYSMVSFFIARKSYKREKTMVKTKLSFTKKVLLALLSLLFVLSASAILFVPSANKAFAASEKVAEFHFWAVNAGSGTKTDNGITFSYSGVTAHEYETSKVSIASGGTLRITVAENQLTANSIGKAAFSIRVDSGIAISYNLKRGSTTLSSGSGKTSYDVGETSIAGSGDLVLEFTNNSGSTATGVHFENPNFALYEITKRTVSITAGTGVKSVYMSTSSTATSGDSSGTQYADGTTVYGFAKLNKGYSAQSGWTLVSGTANAENAIYRVGSKTISNSQKSFGTISADATSYSISYTLNGGTASGNPTTYKITTATITLNNPTKTGYTFAGWTGSNGSTPQTSVSIANGSTGDKSYTANWTANNYTVTFDKNNGTGGSNSVSATYGSAMPSATMPTRTGYTFSGYFDSNNVKYYNANGTSAKSWDKASAATLTASWQINQYPVSCPASTDHASFFISSSNNATSGVSSGNFDYNSTVYFYVIADEGYYKPDGSSWQKTGTSGDRIVYRANSLTVSTGTNEFSVENPQRGADITASATGYNAPFDKGSHSITVSVTTPASDYTVKYKVGGGDYSTTNPQYTDVCNVAVEYKVTADGYYPFIGGATIVITQQENVSYTTAPSVIEGLTYNGAPQALLNAGVSDYGTVQYKLGAAGEWSASVPNVQNVGEYVVYYRVPADANQAGIPESSFNVSIAEVDKTALADCIDVVSDYYGTIVDDYGTIAGVLDGHNQQISDDYYVEPNVTSQQVADAIVELNGYLDAAKKAVTEAKIDAIDTVAYTTDSKELIDDAKNYFDNELNETQRGLVDSDKKTALENAISLYNDVDAVVLQINAIGTSEDTEAFRQKVADARDAYENLGADRKAIFPADVLKMLTDYEAAISVMDIINAIGDVTYTPESKALIDAANDAYANLTDDQKPLVANYDKLIQANTDYDKVDEAIGKINAIGDVEYTSECKAKIDDARGTYDALSTYQKSIFPENVLKILVDDEKAYDSMNKIRSIGTIENTETCKGKIVEARNTYDGLTADQKGLVSQSFVKELEDAEAAFNAIEKVNAIGKVKYSESSKDLIDEARAIYEELTDEQKKLIPSSVFDTLETAEVTYDNTEKTAKVLSTVFLIIVIILLILLLLLLVYLIYRRVKEKGTKLASVAVLPMMLAGSHYLDAPFIALYVLSGLTLLVLIADIVLILMRPQHLKDLKALIFRKKGQTVETVAPSTDEAKQETAADVDQPNGEEKKVVTVGENKDTAFEIRYARSFKAKLIQADEKLKANYAEIKNEILSYKNVKSRTSWSAETVRAGRQSIFKFGVRGKTLCVYYALNAGDFADSKYKVEEVKSGRFAQVPCLYRIKNGRRVSYAKELIAVIAKKFGLKKGEQSALTFDLSYEDDESLLKRGLIRELKTKTAKTDAPKVSTPEVKSVEHIHSVSVNEADEKMTDEVAVTYIENDISSKAHNGKKAIINIDVLSANFNDGDTVDIEALWEKKLVAKNVGKVKVLAKGTLDKVLNVDLQDYSIQAVKMIVLIGGTVKRAK